MNAITPFDYGGVPIATEQSVRDAATRIKCRMARTALDIIEIGRDLVEVKRQLGHGHFLKWIETEFGMGSTTAQKFMQAAENVGDKITLGVNLPPSVLYALAAPSTPDEIREEVIERSSRGEAVTASDVRALKKMFEEKIADKNEKLQKVKGQKESADAYNNRLINDIRAKSAEADRLADELRHVQEEVRRLSEPNTITLSAVAEPFKIDPQSIDIEAWVTLFESIWTSAPSEAQAWIRRRIET